MHIKQSVKIVNQLGLHARASAKLTQLASSFKSDVFLIKDDQKINAKSIMGVMMLAVGFGSTIDVEVDGEDAQTAMTRIVELFAQKFGESR